MVCVTHYIVILILSLLKRTKLDAVGVYYVVINTAFIYFHSNNQGLGLYLQLYLRIYFSKNVSLIAMSTNSDSLAII